MGCFRLWPALRSAGMLGPADCRIGHRFSIVAVVLAAVLCLALACAWSDAAFGNAIANNRVALVVGNAKYAHAPPLANPHNDAQDIAAALRGLGFTVELAVDLERSEFGSRVTAFAKQTRGADAALFFYAGHGLQVDGENYLLPVDAVLEDETQLPFHAVGLDAVLRGMRSSANLVFLDACRDNPFRGKVAASMGSRSSAVGRGLARVNRSAYRGVFVAFATAAGQTASDGDGRNSPFTAALKKHIAKPGLEINQVLNRARRELANMDQEPWDTSSLKEDFFFVPRSEDVMVPAVPQVVGGPDPAAEAWRQISATTNPRLLERYIEDFPTSGYRWAAEARLDELKRQPFTVVVEPSAARVRILDIEQPYRAGMKLPAGEYRVEASASGYETEVEIVAHGGSPTVHRVVLRTARELLIKDDDLEKVRGARIDRRLSGTELQNFWDREELRAGVLVTGVDADSGAGQAGLRPGDVIVTVNRQTTRNLKNLREAARLNSQQILLRVYRSGRFGNIAVR